MTMKVLILVHVRPTAGLDVFLSTHVTAPQPDTHSMNCDWSAWQHHLLVRVIADQGRHRCISINCALGFVNSSCSRPAAHGPHKVQMMRIALGPMCVLCVFPPSSLHLWVGEETVQKHPWWRREREVYIKWKDICCTVKNKQKNNQQFCSTVK